MLFQINIDQLSPSKLKEYRRFLLDQLLGKPATEKRRIAILDRIDKVDKLTSVQSDVSGCTAPTDGQTQLS